MKPLEADSMPSAMLKSKMRSSAHSVKQWQLASIGFNPPVDEKALVTTETKFSTWTPVINKTSNQQLFQERNNLILHWFDLWTDKQRKQFIHNVLMRCSRSQLKFTRDWFEEVVPVTKLDFTTVLPRILSLYILSFLSPQELCMAAQVNWHWKFLAEQDCLWIPKCVKRGWFLPYSPADNEYGSWKRHYVACAKDLDYLTPREAADMYGTLNEPKTDTEDQEERLRERLIRKRIWEKVAEHKKASLTSRPPWLSNSWTLGSLKSKGHNEKLRASLGQQGLTAALVLIGNQTRSQHSLSQLLRQDTQSHLTQDTALERKMMTMSMQSLPKQMNLSSGSSNSVSFPKASPSQSSPRLLLVSSRIPGYEMLLCSAWVDVIPVLYDYYGTTLEALLYRVEQVLHGQRACSVGVFTEGHPGEIALLKGCTVSQRTVLHPEVRQFWENLSGFVVSRTDGGSLDIFFPLAVSETGMELISNISVLTGLDVSAPTGVGTGSHQHILSEWLGRAVSPSATYFSAPALLCWCRQAERLEEVLLDLRKQMGPQLGDLRTEVCGRVLGQFLFDSVGLSEIHTNVEIARAVAEGLAALSKENCENPLEFLSDFLRRGVSHTSQTATAFLTECVPKGAPLEPPETATLPVGSVDRRTMFARELFHSEKRYVQLLDAVRLVYVTPLRAALSSNRAILSSANVLIIFSDILDVAELNRQFLDELAERIQEWGPSQCIGDVCVKFSTRLRAYTNFFNNYTTILRTIDKCREMVPAFRAFLKRHDKTMATEIMRYGMGFSFSLLWRSLPISIQTHKCIPLKWSGFLPIVPFGSYFPSCVF
ncbi:ECT2L protein, partial [Amia calva]|nr:ECT2L protein [Amia calva]